MSDSKIPLTYLEQKDIIDYLVSHYGLPIDLNKYDIWVKEHENRIKPYVPQKENEIRKLFTKPADPSLEEDDYCPGNGRN
jgi:hypothetical protein